MTERYRFALIGRFGTRFVKPGNVDKLRKTWSEPDDNRLVHPVGLTGKVVFSESDFQYLYRQEKSSYRCEPIEVRIDRYCGSAYTIGWYIGYLDLSEGKWDIDRCTVEISIKTKDQFLCYDRNKAIEFNIMNLVFNRYTMTMNVGAVELFTSDDPTRPAGDGWLQYQEDLQYTQDGTLVYQRYDWARIKRDNGTFTRPILINYTNASTNPPYNGGSPGGYRRFYSYTILSTQYSAIDNGMKLEDVLEKTIDFVCPGMDIKSDFFQINPEIISPTNYVTGKTSTVNNLLLFQKSDVKRPNADNNATRQLMECEKLIENLCNIFNCRWDIVNGTFIIEHVSWFDKTSFDLKTDRYKPHFFHKLKYSYAKEKMPAKETFKFMEQAGVDFVGVPILYNNGCESESSKTSATYEADFITTDFTLVVSNPLADNDPNYNGRVSDKGFFLAACNPDLSIMSAPGILTSEEQPNNVLGWAHLHRDFWMHFRPQKRGTMNGLATTFLSERPIKRGDKIEIPYCCGDEAINFDGLILTPLGTGVVSQASLSLNREVIELELLYEAEEFIVFDAPPVANEDKATTLQDVPIVVDVLANDTDDGNNILPETIEIIMQHQCVATVTDEGKVLITPASGFVGQCLAKYRVQDGSYSWSNEAFIIVSVLADPQAPQAVDDHYSIGMNMTLIVPKPGVLKNDSGVPTLKCVPATKATPHGTAKIFADGSIEYRPVAGYSGNDSFEYTMFGGSGIQDTATVTVNVMPHLFARTRLTNRVIEPIMQTCDGVHKQVGTRQYEDLQIEFFADAGGSITFRADQVQVSINRKTSEPGPVVTDETLSFILSGDKPFVLKRTLTQEINRGCNNELNISRIITFQLLPSPNYTII